MDVCSFTYPASLVRRHPPSNLLPGDERCFIHELVKCFSAEKAVNLRDVVVSGDGLCVVGQRGLPSAALVPPSLATPLRQRLKAGVLVARRLLRTVPATRCERIEKALLLTDAYFDGFFHWFGDILPKVEALRQCHADLSEHVILMPASRHAAYVAESLAAFGLSCRVVPFGDGVLVERLCFIPRLTPTGNYRPELMRGIRAVVRERFATPETGIRLYVSRKEAPKRRLLNEPALEAMLARHGFTSVCMERLPFAEQVALASRCEMLAGLHGAGLTHMLWARRNATVMEIRGQRDSQNNCYYSLASDLGHDYYYVPARKQSGLRPSFLADYVVDVDRFEATLTQALAAGSAGGGRNDVA